MLPPRRAAVTPRVRTSPASGALPLERVVRGFIDAGARGVIVVHAPPGGGKTTALSHLCAVLSEFLSRVYIVDEPLYTAHLRQNHELSVVALREPGSHDLALLELVPWAEDEWIEYLAANHRATVAPVMSRLKEDATRHALAGAPQLWTIVLEAMAADELLATASAALRRHLLTLFPDNRSRVAAGSAAACTLRCEGVLAPARVELSDGVVSLLRHRIVRLILAADWLATALSAGGAPPVPLAQPLERDLLSEAGVALRDSAAARARLADLLHRDRNRAYDAAAASLLLATDLSWRPSELRGRRLLSARLDGASWNGIDLTGADLTAATFRGAQFSRATLVSAALASADFSRANLVDATLSGAMASDAQFTGARLTGCRADGARFWAACFQNADFSNARLVGCELHRADLRGATLRCATLEFAHLYRTIVEETDFTGANFRHAKLEGVVLRAAASLTGASFVSASLLGCDLEGMELPRADFAGARLDGCLFTGSRMPAANFRGAKLTDTGLADIDWPNADLRNADFTGASFHMGSSRSGSVGSPIASEGSRTGFYTDDYNDQDFKRPEEIRKANLCGADLRGAKVEKADFYLVDLRGARYTPEQAEHFARCGAILRSRVA